MKKRKENNELSTNFSAIKRKAILSAGIYTIIPLAFAILGAIFWKNELQGNLPILYGYGIVVLVMCIRFFFSTKKSYQEDEERKLKTVILEKCLSIQQYTPIKPINMDEFKEKMLNLVNSYIEILPLQSEEGEYKEYITELLETAKFYAHIPEDKKDSIEIFVKYDKEGKLRYYKSVKKEVFLDEYEIQEEE